MATMHFFALSLLVVAASCASASPTCSEDEASKCSAGHPIPEPFPTTPEAMDEVCKHAFSVMDCLIDFAHRCPNTMTGVFLPATLEYKKLYGALCSDTDLRRNYFENAVCMRETEPKIRDECDLKSTDYCKNQRHLIECGRKVTVEDCGVDAGGVYDAFAKITKATIAIFGCVFDA